jgi:hypothetical protein
MVFEDLQWADPTSRELLDRNMWLSLGAPGKLAHSRACEGEPSARLCSGEIALVRRLQVDAPFDREFEFLVRPLEYLNRLAVIHMHELRADDPFEFRDQPLLDPLVEEGEIFPVFRSVTTPKVYVSSPFGQALVVREIGERDLPALPIGGGNDWSIDPGNTVQPKLAVHAFHPLERCRLSMRTPRAE